MAGIAERIRSVARADEDGRPAASTTDVLRDAADALEAAKTQIDELTRAVADFVALTDIGRMRDFAEVKRTLAQGRALISQPLPLVAQVNDLSLRLRALASRTGNGHDRIEKPVPAPQLSVMVPEPPAPATVATPAAPAITPAAEAVPMAALARTAAPDRSAPAGRDMPIDLDSLAPEPATNPVPPPSNASTEMADAIDRLLARSRGDQPIVTDRPIDSFDTTSDEIAFAAQPPASAGAGRAGRPDDKMDTVLAEIEASLRKPG